jgi:hypothetical protein
MKAKIISLLIIVAALAYPHHLNKQLEYNLMPNDQFTAQPPDKYLKAFIGTIRGRVISTAKVWYIIRQYQKAGINPLVGLAMCQKESSLLQGGTAAKKNESLAMGYWPENKKRRGFYTQVYLSARCLKRHYEYGKKHKKTTVRLQDGKGWIHGLNAAEYALFMYNPVERGNRALYLIYNQYASGYNSVSLADVAGKDHKKIGWNLTDFKINPGI